MNTKYPLLNLMMKDMALQDQLYKPTAFWEFGSSQIIEALEKYGVENFRQSANTRHFFVPGYTVVEYLEDPEKYDKVVDDFRKMVTDQRFAIRIEKLFKGHTGAFNDYRVLLASNIDKKPFTDTISESKIGNPLEQIAFDERYFSKSMMNYLLGLNFLKRTVDTSNISTVMEIGGGFGTLGEILLGDKRNEAFYINADIPPVGFVSSYYLQEVFGKEQIADYEMLKDLEILDIETLKKKYMGLNLCSWQVPQLRGKIDLFVNFISFQEMEPEIVENYCNYVNKLEPKYILLRNMLEGKRKQSETFKAGVLDPILGDDYNKFLPNYKLIAKDSAVFGFITEDNFHSELRIYERI